MLKCKVNTKELQEGLKKLDAIRPNNHRFEVVTSIKIESANNNQIELTSTDLQNYLIITLDAEVITPGKALINNVKNVMKSFKYFKNTYTTIEIKDNDIIIGNDKKEIKTITNPVEDFPKNPQTNIINKYTYNTKDLYNRLNKVKCAIANDDTRPILTGVHFNKEDIVTLDGYKLALNKDNKLNINKPFTVNNSCNKALLKLLDKKNEKELHIMQCKENIIFEFENIKLISKLLEGDFMRYEDILPSYCKYEVTANTKELKNNMEFLSLYSKTIKMH